MGAKVIRHPRNTESANGPPKRGAPQRGRPNHRGYPDGHGTGGYAGQPQEEGGTTVVCEAPKLAPKAKFPWGTVLLTGVVSTVGVIAAYKVYSKVTGGDDPRRLNPEPEPVQNSLPTARDYLLLTAPGADNALGRMPQAPAPVVNPGPSAREIAAVEQASTDRARLAEIEGFIAGQVAAKQQQQQEQKTDLSALLSAAESDD